MAEVAPASPFATLGQGKSPSLTGTPIAPSWPTPSAESASAPANNALLVTSGASRAATANSVTNLQKVTTNLTPPAAKATPSPDGGSGSVATPMGKYKLNENGDIVSNDAYGSIIATKGNFGSVTDASGQALTGLDEKGNLAYGAATKPAGETAIETDANTKMASGIKDPALAASFKAILDANDKQVAQAQANIDQARATVLNDPAALAAIDSIKQKYDQMINLMKDKNKQVLGRADTSVAAFGGLGSMSQSFLNDQQAKADARISDLVAKEQDLILKATIAYQTNDLKALNSAMDAYDKANKEKLTAINTLLTETHRQVTEMQAQDRIDAAAAKSQITTDIQQSNQLAAGMVENIAEAGITDPKQIDAYVQSMAEEYGITNVDFLASAVAKAQATADKAALSEENTKSNISAREERLRIAKAKAANTGGTGGGKFVASQAILKVTPQMESVKGPDGFIDPSKWVKARANWQSLGGTEASFKSNFIKYLNPADYAVAGYKAPGGGGATPP